MCDLSVIFNIIMTSLWWDRELVNYFIINKNAGLLFFAFTYVKLVEGLLFSRPNLLGLCVGTLIGYNHIKNLFCFRWELAVSIFFIYWGVALTCFGDKSSLLVNKKNRIGVLRSKVQGTTSLLLHINLYGTMWGRTYSTKAGSLTPLEIGSTLDPFFLTGFADGESCFRIALTKRDNLVGWRVQQFFQITLHRKDRALLEGINKYWGVGQIHKSGQDLLQYRVQSFVEIEKVLNHFEKFPLISNKCADFELFKESYKLVLNKEHLTHKGLHKIVAIRASLNLGLSEQLQTAFPDVVPVARPLVPSQKIQDANWLAGFVTAEGCFMVSISKSQSKTVGFQVYLVFVITQHVRDEELMRSLIDYLGCGNLRRKRDVFEYQVSKFSDLIEKIIPFFKKYPISGEKSKDFSDFCAVADLMRTKVHLTKEGVEKIRKIKEKMNTGREFS